MIFIVLTGVIGILLIVAIVLQNQGSGLSTAFGGGSGEFYRSKRSVERILVWATGFLAFLFAALALIMLLRH